MGYTFPIATVNPKSKIENQNETTPPKHQKR
jgi:hypothetical protein